MKISSIPAWMLAVSVLVLTGCTQPPAEPTPMPVPIEAETTNTESTELIDKVLEEVLQEADIEDLPALEEFMDVEIEILETAPAGNAQTFNYENPETVVAEPVDEGEKTTYTEAENAAWDEKSPARRSRAS